MAVTYGIGFCLSVSTNLLLEVRGEEGEGNFAGAVGERQRVAGEDLQLVNQVVRQARLLRRETRICYTLPLISV